MEFDFLVLGSGIAGLTFALHVAPHGSVGIMTKKHRSESNTNYAQGGIAAAIGADDSWELHRQDTLKAGVGLCDPEAVTILVQNGARLVEWLLSLGAQLDKERLPDGTERLALGQEGGHSRPRIVHAADHTGWEIERTLLRAVRNSPYSITLLEHYFVLDLILQEGNCRGAYVLDTATGDVVEVYAQATLLATGGCGQVYQHTTNPPIATGDGIGMAWRAGATIANMEFIQFHPTALYPSEGHAFLISEAVRGEGGLLKRRDGYRFMPDYDPRAELAPRDVVARAIDAELKKQGDPYVYLDVTHLPAERIRARFPTIYERCLQYGIDITTDPIPVVPAAHYSCGGVWTDLWGQTSIPRLYACGEVACTNVHGANRLASNSLLEALVFAERAAQHAIVTMRGEIKPQGVPNPSSPVQTPMPNVQSPRRDVESWTSEREALRGLMWQKVGIVRSVARLQEALAKIQPLYDQVEKEWRETPPTVELGELRNLVCTAYLIVQSALLRKESRGLHYVEEYPQRDDEHFGRPTLLTKPEQES